MLQKTARDITSKHLSLILPPTIVSAPFSSKKLHRHEKPGIHQEYRGGLNPDPTSENSVLARVNHSTDYSATEQYKDRRRSEEIKHPKSKTYSKLTKTYDQEIAEIHANPPVEGRHISQDSHYPGEFRDNELDKEDLVASAQEKAKTPISSLLSDALKDIGNASTILAKKGLLYMTKFTKTITSVLREGLAATMHKLDLKLTSVVRRLLIEDSHNLTPRQKEELYPKSVINPSTLAISEDAKLIAKGVIPGHELGTCRLEDGATNEIQDNLEDTLEKTIGPPRMKASSSPLVHGSEREVISNLISRGYTEKFDIIENQIALTRLGKRFSIHDIRLIEAHQFDEHEGGIKLFAIEASENTKKGPVKYKGIAEVSSERFASSALGRFVDAVSHPTSHVL